MKRKINTSTSGKWLMPEGDLIALMQNYSAMTEANNAISKEDMEKHIATHIPVKTIDANLLSDSEKAAFGLSFANSTKASNGKVAIIQIFGSLFARWDYYMYWYGGVAMDMLGEILDALEKDSGIDGVVLHIDSNGGELAGTELLGKKIFKFTKPILAYADNAAHSAAYWLASQCNEIYAASLTTYMGSIGVVMRHVNRGEMYKMNGLEITYVAAPQSTNKIIAPENKAISDKDMQILQDILRQDAAVFINAVKNGRKDKVDIEAVSSADIFSAVKAKALGMHDGIAANGLSDVVARVYKLSEEKKSNKFAENTTSKTSSKKAKNIMEKLTNINIQPIETSVMAAFKNKKLVLVAVADLTNLNAKLAGMGADTLEKQSADVKQSYDALGITPIKATTMNILSYDKRKFVLVDADSLNALDGFCKSLSEEESTETTETAESNSDSKTAETTEIAVEENSNTDTATEESAAVVVEEKAAETSNISAEIQALMASVEEMKLKFATESESLKKALSEAELQKAAALEDKEKVIANANELQKKFGMGKIITVKPDSKEGNGANYDLGDKSQRANNAALAAKSILKEKQPNADKSIYDPEKQITL